MTSNQINTALKMNGYLAEPCTNDSVNSNTPNLKMSSPPGPPVDSTEFEYLAADGTATTATSKNPARIIADYIWAPNTAGRRATGKGPTQGTIASLSADNIGEWRCIHCKDQGDRCKGQECVDTFRANAADVLESLELRAEPDPALGFGVHCKRAAATIPAGSILGEYLGEVSLVQGDLSVSPEIIKT